MNCTDCETPTKPDLPNSESGCPASSEKTQCYVTPEESCPQTGTLQVVYGEGCEKTETLLDADGNPVEVWTKAACPQPVDVCGVVKVEIVDPDPLEREITKLCDPQTLAPILVVTDIAVIPPASVAYNLDGSEYAGAVGDLVSCDSQNTDSDLISWCVDGQEFNQHLITLNGVPTGDVYWTDSAGAVVPNPIPAATVALKGTCSQTAGVIDIPMCEIQ